MRVLLSVLLGAMLLTVVGCQSPGPAVTAAPPAMPQKTTITTPQGVIITPYQPDEIQRQKL